MRLIEGNRGHGSNAARRKSPSGTGVGTQLSPPRWLPKEARSEFVRVARLNKNRFGREDRAMLVSYATNWAHSVAIERELAGDVGLKRRMMLHRWLAQHQKLMISAADRLGLSPAARTRLNVKLENPGAAGASGGVGRFRRGPGQ